MNGRQTTKIDGIILVQLFVLDRFLLDDKGDKGELVAG